jgi:pSer/pThr/pTyr-binding forkhead associated (FHA) protein
VPQSHELAAPEPSAMPQDNLAFAETAPPVLDEGLMSRPIPDRGSRGSANPPEPQRTSRPSLGGDPRNPLSIPPGAPRVLAGFLVSYDGNPLGQSWSIHQGTNLLGRQGSMAGADVEFPHATVSSRHATLFAKSHPGRMVLEEQGSTNGTFVNDTALSPGQQRELRDGDRVRLGLFNLIAKIL